MRKCEDILIELQQRIPELKSYQEHNSNGASELPYYRIDKANEIKFGNLSTKNIKVMTAQYFSESTLDMVKCLSILDFFLILMKSRKVVNLSCYISYNESSKEYAIDSINEYEDLNIEIWKVNEDYHFVDMSIEPLKVSERTDDLYLTILNCFNSHIDKYLDRSIVSSKNYEMISDLIDMVKI